MLHEEEKKLSTNQNKIQASRTLKNGFFKNKKKKMVHNQNQDIQLGHFTVKQKLLSSARKKMPT